MHIGRNVDALVVVRFCYLYRVVELAIGMIQSMTGMGKTMTQVQGRSLTIFIKTLNSKQLDITSRLPNSLRERELEMRTMIAERLLRGKVELQVALEEGLDSLSEVQIINEDALRYYASELERLLPAMLPSGTVNTMEQLLRLPGVLVSREVSMQALNDEAWEIVKASLEDAIDALIAFRTQEGEMLAEVLGKRIANIEALLDKVDQPEHERIDNIRIRLEDALQKIAPEGIDRGRLEQELIYYIEKLDINEEKDRLKHHLRYFREVMSEAKVGQGKILGFIAQEIGREINTLGSKSNHAELQQIVVRMKDELEQIKEQVLNAL